jgi:hypothetical protein
VDVRIEGYRVLFDHSGLSKRRLEPDLVELLEDLNRRMGGDL